MIPYYLYFTIPLIFYIFSSLNYDLNRISLSFSIKLIFFCVSIIFVGLRYEVGGDWYTYIVKLEDEVFDSLLKTLKYDPTNLARFSVEPGWSLITWISKRLGLGIVGVNFFSSLIFFTSLWVLLNQSRNFWLSVLISIPYLVIIVSMGYIRQSVALGFFMIAISFIIKNDRHKTFYFLFFVILGASFHRSLFIMLPLIFFINNKIISFKNVFLGILIILFILLYFKDIFIGSLYTNYIKQKMITGMQSEGALTRIVMSSVPSLIYIVFYKDLPKEDRHIILLIMSFLILACLFFIKVGSTAIDRFSLYLLPIQFLIWPIIIRKIDEDKLKLLLNFSIICVYFFSIIVWMNFAKTKRGWLPYKSILTENHLVLQRNSVFGIRDESILKIND